VREEDTGNSLFHLAIENFSYPLPFLALLRRLEQEFIAQKRPGDLRTFIMNNLHSTKNKQGKSALDLPNFFLQKPQVYIDSHVKLYYEERSPHKKGLYKKYDKPGFLKGPTAFYPLTHPLAKSLKKGLNIGYGCGNPSCKVYAQLVRWLPFGTGVIGAHSINEVLDDQPQNKCPSCQKESWEILKVAVMDANYWVYGELNLTPYSGDFTADPRLDRDVSAKGQIAYEDQLVKTYKLKFFVSE